MAIHDPQIAKNLQKQMNELELFSKKLVQLFPAEDLVVDLQEKIIGLRSVGNALLEELRELSLFRWTIATLRKENERLNELLQQSLNRPVDAKTPSMEIDTQNSSPILPMPQDITEAATSVYISNVSESNVPQKRAIVPQGEISETTILPLLIEGEPDLLDDSEPPSLPKIAMITELEDGIAAAPTSRIDRETVLSLAAKELRIQEPAGTKEAEHPEVSIPKTESPLSAASQELEKSKKQELYPKGTKTQRTQLSPETLAKLQQEITHISATTSKPNLTKAATTRKLELAKLPLQKNRYV